jgi:hypothetical protein
MSGVRGRLYRLSLSLPTFCILLLTQFMSMPLKGPHNMLPAFRTRLSTIYATAYNLHHTASAVLHGSDIKMHCTLHTKPTCCTTLPTYTTCFLPHCLRPAPHCLHHTSLPQCLHPAPHCLPTLHIFYLIVYILHHIACLHHTFSTSLLKSCTTLPTLHIFYLKISTSCTTLPPPHHTTPLACILHRTSVSVQATPSNRSNQGVWL